MTSFLVVNGGVFSLFSSRYFHWQLNLYCMLITVIFIIPFYVAHLMVDNIRIGQFLALYVIYGVLYIFCTCSIMETNYRLI